MEMNSTKADFDPQMLPDILPIYYKRLFPFGLYYQWLAYGEIDKDYFAKREFSFTLADDVYIRYQSFANQSELEKAVLSKNPYKIDIGAVYNYKPTEHKTASSFQAIEKELVFDIDMTDYDEVRTCCKATDICLKCWPLMTVAMKIIDRCLRDDFGFKHILWVFSGRRGIHCWVCDQAVRKLSAYARSAIASYLSVVRGGQFKMKKVSLGGGNIHPSISEAVSIIENYFDDLIISKQGLLDSNQQYKCILAMTSDSEFSTMLQREFEKCESGAERWEVLKKLSSSFNKKGIDKFAKEVMLQLCYPRLDINVTKGLNHLLKAPFCIHPKTGRVCIPIDIRNVDRFNPFEAPTVSQLISELDAYGKRQQDAVEGEPHQNGDSAPTKKPHDFEKTSLASSIKLFREFVKKLETSHRIEKTAHNGNYEF